MKLSLLCVCVEGEQRREESTQVEAEDNTKQLHCIESYLNYSSLTLSFQHHVGRVGKTSSFQAERRQSRERPGRSLGHYQPAQMSSWN